LTGGPPDGARRSSTALISAPSSTATAEIHSHISSTMTPPSAP
jgi:hypothetical protein